MLSGIRSGLALANTYEICSVVEGGELTPSLGLIEAKSRESVPFVESVLAFYSDPSPSLVLSLESHAVSFSLPSLLHHQVFFFLSHFNLLGKYVGSLYSFSSLS